MTIAIDLSKLVTASDKADQAKAAVREAIASRRWQAMASGTIVAGMEVHTDDTAQTRILGAALAATLDPDYTLAWKTVAGEFVTLTAPQVLAIAQAIRAHVQACYDREAELIAALEAGEGYDIEAGWP